MGILTIGNENPRWVGRKYQCPRGHFFALEEKDKDRLDKSEVSSDHGNVSTKCPQCGAVAIIPWIDLCSDARLDQAMGKDKTPKKS